MVVEVFGMRGAINRKFFVMILVLSISKKSNKKGIT